MKLRFFNAEGLDRNLKATVHKSGKLGFTIDAANKLGLSKTKSIGVATNEEDTSDNSLYVVVYEGLQNGAFKIGKGGDYYYINTKPLFDLLKINYIKEWIVFDIVEEKFNDQKIFKLTRREKSAKSANTIEK